jgi:hypothetical protein
MEIKEEFPPNFAELKQYFDLEKYKPFFTWGSVIYNPYKQVIPIDIKIHEEVHSKQQMCYTSPSIWWTKYLLDRSFRQEQETEAYAVQYQWLKERLPAKGSKEALNEISQILSSPLYDLGITSNQAETLIRHYQLNK